MFLFIIFMASFDLSHSITFFAPLLAASSPIAPLPENTSKKFEFIIWLCIILNIDSFTLSNVGLVVWPSNVNNFVPLAVPLIILILLFLLCYNFILFFVNVNRINKIVI